MNYRLVVHNAPVMRTSFWKDQDDPKHREPSYWIEWDGLEGHTHERPATVDEIAIYRWTVERAIAVVKPFTTYVNVTVAGGTPEAALRKEFDCPESAALSRVAITAGS